MEIKNQELKNKKEINLLSKWEEVFNDWESYSQKQKELRNLIKKGVPNEIRPKLWLKLSKAEELMKKPENINVYQNLIALSDLSTQSQISKDSVRTFPNHPKYEPNEGLPGLSNILKAWTGFAPDLGYCSGMNQIAALILLIFEQYEEEIPFWVFVGVLEEKKFNQIFNFQFKLIQKWCYLVSELIKKFHPKLASIFENNQIEYPIFLYRYFATLFSDLFPISDCARIWDFFLLDGEEFLFKLAVALLSKKQKNLENKSFEDILMILIQIKFNEPIDELIQLAYKYDIKNIVEIKSKEFDEKQKEKEIPEQFI
ncbi:tbc1 domain family member whacked [Anaeramoeba ignava]|uniref:Tbc1 domain family member whacked n=1 Tax=Anaeramoeba ignava TaxID=1746090 RepID=A0A9Q0L7W0_ANAIG|nr:tbc1 domain family member whacked [Anaeramoeba ignava]